MKTVYAYFVSVGKCTIGHCYTLEEAEEWKADLENGVFKGKEVVISKEQVEEDFWEEV